MRLYISPLRDGATLTHIPRTDYLQWNYGVSQWQYVQAIQAGTEPFTGSASLFTNNFNVALNHY